MTAPEPAWEGGPDRERLESLLAYCKLTELAEDPEVMQVLRTLYLAAVGYLTAAGVAEPEAGTARRAQYDQCVNYLVLDGWDRRERYQEAEPRENPAFRLLLNQLKFTEGV